MIKNKLNKYNKKNEWGTEIEDRAPSLLLNFLNLYILKIKLYYKLYYSRIYYYRKHI